MPRSQPAGGAAATAAHPAGLPAAGADDFTGRPGSIELFTPASGGQPQKPHPPGEDTAAPRPAAFPAAESSPPASATAGGSRRRIMRGCFRCEGAPQAKPRRNPFRDQKQPVQ